MAPGPLPPWLLKPIPLRHTSALSPGRYASIRDADLVEEVRQLLSSSNPQDGTLDPAELYYDSCLIFCGEGGGELGRLSLSSREMCHALVQISDRQEDRDRAA